MRLTARELDIMGVLWDRGPCRVREVRDALAERGADLAYTSVLTVLQILEAKGRVSHSRAGRAYVYRAKVREHEAARAAIRQLLETYFDGKPSRLIAALRRKRTR